MSNHLLDTPWPKVERTRTRLQAYLEANPKLSVEPLLDLLYDREPADEGALPDTGVGLELERLLSPPFIVSPEYGTRCTTVLLVDVGGGYPVGRAYLRARRYAPRYADFSLPAVVRSN